MDVLRTPHLLFLLSYVEVLQSRVAQSPLWPSFCRESMYLRDSSHREYIGGAKFLRLGVWLSSLLNLSWAFYFEEAPTCRMSIDRWGNKVGG